ncbi:MAG: type II toxin-antitoxin system VapC family toxin [Propionibacteriaceae bacterium]|nr:type II toxin-antitoxin system VapC family toxin [Propionibacteriaceae bacterium]
MIGLDTNVLLRYLAADDPVQSPAARDLLEARTADDPAYISLVTLLETCWTLRSAFGRDRAAVNAVVGALAALDEIVLQEPAAVAEALAVAEGWPADFPDALVAVLGRRAGCGQTATFDRRAAAIPGMALVAPAEPATGAGRPPGA